MDNLPSGPGALVECSSRVKPRPSEQVRLASQQTSFRRVHKLVGIVIGAQLLFWTVSGFYFTLFPIETIRGTHLRSTAEQPPIDTSQPLLPVAEVLRKADTAAAKLVLESLLGTPVWRLGEGSEAQIIHAISGERLSPVSAATAQAVAQSALALEAEPTGQPLLLSADPPREYAGPLPVWVVSYASENLRVYVPANTAHVYAVRTTRWRIFDVLWRFHIMDVTGADRFDSWWLKLAAFFGLAMSITGIALLLRLARRGRLFA